MSEQDKSDRSGRVTRREFIQTASLGGAALAVSPAAGKEAPAALPESGKVFAVHHKDVCPVVDEYRPADKDVVKAMVKEAVLQMGIAKDVAGVVGSWCPEGKTPATVRVKVKFCGLVGKFPAHTGVVNGVVRLLIDEGGVTPGNIHVYEYTASNFGERNRPPYIGTPFAGGKNREEGVVYSHLDAPYRADMKGANYKQEVNLDVGGMFKMYTFHFWDALDKDTDVIINIPVLKRHLGGFTMPSITLSMKNHFGSIRSPYKHHGFEVSRKIAALNMTKLIREKQRLIVMDALYAMYTRGPTMGRMKYGINKLIVARDPVATDYVGWGMLNAVGKEKHEEANKDPAVPYRPFGEPREIAIAALNSIGHRAPKWQDHVTEIDLKS